MTLDNEGAIKLIRFLYDIKKRPQLFLEQKSYTQLYYAILGFITGYFYASGYSAIEYLNNMGNVNISATNLNINSVVIKKFWFFISRCISKFW